MDTFRLIMTALTSRAARTGWAASWRCPERPRDVDSAGSMGAVDAIDILVERLRADGTAERTDDGVRILRFEGRDFDPPLLLRTNAHDLAEHIRRTAKSAVGLFDDSPEPAEAAGWALFDIHVTEAIDTRRSGENLLIITGGGVDSVFE